jgi:N-acetylmuramoyl-L-alanine amidase
VVLARLLALISIAVGAILSPQGAVQSAPGRATRVPAQEAAQPACDRAQFRVVVDVGHSAEVPGATSARGVPEYDFNLRLANRIGKDLAAAGFRQAQVLVTPGPAKRGLFMRVARAANLTADLFISIHHDSVPERFLQTWVHEGTQLRYSDHFRGHSIFISYDNPDAAASYQFARLLGGQLKKRGLQYTPHYAQAFMQERRRDLLDADAGVYRYDQLIVLKDTRMPAVLFEAGSIIHRDEEVVMSDPRRHAVIGAAVTEAVDRYCAGRAPVAPVARRSAPARSREAQRETPMVSPASATPAVQ